MTPNPVFRSRLIRPVLLAGAILVSLWAAGVAVASPAAAGRLEAKVTADPWSFRLTDGNGRRVLDEYPGTGDSPAGTLGFRVGDHWEHAVRATGSSQSGNTLTYQVETTDATRSLEVTISAGTTGEMTLNARILGSTDGVEAIGMGFRAPAAERYLGFGERSNSVNQRGNVVESWTAEGPYGNHEATLVAGSVPAWGLRTGSDGNSRPDSTYFPMPWLLSTAGYGVLVDDTRPSYFRIASDRDDAWSVEVSRRLTGGLAQEPADPPPPTELTLRFFAGPRPADVVRRLSLAIGRQPDPAAWFLGPWVQSKGGDANTVTALRENDVPTSVMQTYAHYLPCGGQDPATEQARTGLFHTGGMAVTTYFNPMICTSYSPVYGNFRDAGAVTRRPNDLPYTFNYLSYNVGETDFSAAQGPQLYGDLLRSALGAGYDGWMEDFGEYHPPDAKISDGTPGMVAHNRYPRDYHCAAQSQVADTGRPVLRYVRSGYTGSAACSPVVWGGDPSTVWDFDGLRSAITNGLTMGLSGVGLWGSDIGGFFTILSPDLTPELLTRWIEFGAFSGVMRDQADGYIVGANRSRAQILAPEQIQLWRRYSKLRTQLYPYIRGAVAEYRDNGMPLMQALALRYPGDRRAVAVDDQYMFGNDLMVAPVTTTGARDRQVYLPKGRWFNLWRSLKFNQASDFRMDLARASALSGGGWQTVTAPLEEIPVMARAGAMLVTVSDEVDTLAPYGSGQPGLDRLADRPGRRLLALPSGRSSSRFQQWGRIESRERAGRSAWRLAIRDATPRHWEIQASLASLRKPFRPRCLTVDGRRRAFTYRRKGRLLTVDFRAKSKRSVIKVSGRRCPR